MSLCKFCPLSSPIQIAGYGSKSAKLIVIGEYPTNTDEKYKSVFGVDPTKDNQVTSANWITHRSVKVLGLNPDEAYLCNALRCNPYRTVDKLDSAKKYTSVCRTMNLDKELAEIDAEVILVMGKVALDSLLPSLDIPVAKARGGWYRANIGGKHRWIRVTFSQNQIYKQSMWEVQKERTGYVRLKRWSPVGSCGWFYMKDLKAVKLKLEELYGKS